MITVYVNPLSVLKDTVSFSWNTSKELNIFKKDNFYIKYDGMNIEKMPNSVHWNSFLSLMIPLLKTYGEEIVFVFPEDVPYDIVETWVNFNETKDITIFPISSVSSKQCFDEIDKKENSKIGILFGGGKDSSFTFSLLSEMYGVENLLLISYVFPLDKQAMNKADERREKFILEQLKKDYGVKVQKVYTDFRATLLDQTTGNHVHTTIYTGTAVPIIGNYNLSLLTYSYEFNHYWTNYYDNKKEHLSFKRSRPEFDDFVSKRTNKVFNTDFAIKNFNYFISETVAFKMLAKRYPHMLKYLLMCEATVDTNVKWCRKCHKCAEFALYSLCYQLEQKDIDYTDFFINSPYIQKVLKATKELPLLEGEGNCRWDPSIVFVGHYQSFCHIIGSIDIEYVKERTNEEAFENFMLLKKRFGNRTYPIYEGIIDPAFKKMDPPKGQEIKQILGEYCPVVYNMPEYLLWGNTKIVIDYDYVSKIPNIFKQEFKKGTYYSNVATKLVEAVKESSRSGEFLNKESIFSGNINDYQKVIPYKNIENKTEMEFYIDKSNPSVGDFVEWRKRITVTQNQPVNIRFNINSPYMNHTLKDRLVYKVFVDGKEMVQEDISMWDSTNEVNIYTNPVLNEIEISVQILAVKNCEPWNWGYAGRVLISNLQVKECKKSPDLWVSCTSPYSMVSLSV